MGRINEYTRRNESYLFTDGVTLMLDFSAVTLSKLLLAATAIVIITVNNYSNYKKIN